jgi:DNA repair exonuclease SbcCD nuclease subunit
MKRKNKNKSKRPTAIITSDIHLSETIPASRIDDFLHAQKVKLKFLTNFQAKYNCPVIDAGDIFHHWKPSPWLMSRAYDLLPDDMITIPGNHDLPGHSLEFYNKSGLSFLESVGKLTVLKNQFITNDFDLCIRGVAYGQDTNYAKIKKENNAKRNILVIHEMVFPDRGCFYLNGAESICAMDILKEFGHMYDLVITGHNHKAFTVKREDTGSILVNPGSMMRRTADQENYKPCFFFYYAEENEVEQIHYPIEDNVFDTRHITVNEEREKRLQAYIEKMNTRFDIGFSFVNNLEMFFKENKTPKRIRELIYENLEEDK